MKYTHAYYKLVNQVYTTIRKTKRKKQEVGSIETEKVNNVFWHKAIILHIDMVKLSELPLGILLMDCIYPNSKIETRNDCYNLFQSFYKKEIDFENQNFYLFILKKTPGKIQTWL